MAAAIIVVGSGGGSTTGLGQDAGLEVGGQGDGRDQVAEWQSGRKRYETCESVQLEDDLPLVVYSYLLSLSLPLPVDRGRWSSPPH